METVDQSQPKKPKSVLYVSVHLFLLKFLSLTYDVNDNLIAFIG
jgi:hypothetical protein